jgi:DNA polymerase elongation subunit (family B)
MEYVNFFNEIKSISNVHKNFGKLMINSLYGRMGMSFIKDETILIDEKKFLSYQKKENIKSFKKINKLIIMTIEKNTYKKSESNIIMASCITSKARIKLYKAQLDVIKNGGRILYSDTDSIFAAYKKDVSNEIHGIVD